MKLAGPPNLLLMDEPTTHLDLASVDARCSRRCASSKALIFISHDVYSFAGQSRRASPGWASDALSGGYDYYLDRRLRSAAEAPRAPAARRGRAFDEGRSGGRRRRQARYGSARRRASWWASAESPLAKAGRLCLVASSSGHLRRSGAGGRDQPEMQTLLPEIERLTAQWRRPRRWPRSNRTMLREESSF